MAPAGSTQLLLTEIRRQKLLWLLVFVPIVLVAERQTPDAHTTLFVLAVLAIVPLAALLSHATESVAAKTGDAAGGLLNATLGNLTELVIAITALRAGQYMLVKASIAGAIVTNSLFMLGMSFLLGGLKHRVQEYNRANARLHAGLLFLATVALIAPSALNSGDGGPGSQVTQQLSLGLSIMLMVGYGLGLAFSLKTHRDLFSSGESGHGEEAAWPMGLALGTLAVVTLLVALVSEIFVASVQEAAVTFGMTPAFVGFVVVSLVGAAAEMASAFSAARKNRLDMSVGIALGSSSQIALFVAPALVLLSYGLGPSPMDLQLWPGAVLMTMIAALTAFLVTSTGRSAWFVGVLVLMVYMVFAMTLYLLPPAPVPRIAVTLSIGASRRVLDPIDRVSEVLFGLIMVLTFTGSLSVAEAGRDDTRTMLIGALGCNLAWGIIDAVLYLMGGLAAKGRIVLGLRAARQTRDRDAAQRTIADLLPEPIAAVVQPGELASIEERLRQIPEPAIPWLDRDDWRGALAVFLLVFLSTFPVTIPFLLFDSTWTAMRASNGIAIVMLFVTGFAFGQLTGRGKWQWGMSMVVLGAALAGLTIRLGG